MPFPKSFKKILRGFRMFYGQPGGFTGALDFFKGFNGTSEGFRELQDRTCKPPEHPQETMKRNLTS